MATVPRKIIRKQTYLLPAQDVAIKRIAAREGVTESEILRRAVAEFLARAEERKVPRNPFLDLIGAFEGPPGRGADTLDEDLYGKG